MTKNHMESSPVSIFHTSRFCHLAVYVLVFQVMIGGAWAQTHSFPWLSFHWQLMNRRSHEIKTKTRTNHKRFQEDIKREPAICLWFPCWKTEEWSIVDDECLSWWIFSNSMSSPLRYFPVEREIKDLKPINLKKEKIVTCFDENLN